MKRLQIEQWALSVVDSVVNHRPFEDAFIELKREWPEPEKAARRIAGQANAARGEPILWLIGVDQDRGPVDTPQIDLAQWRAQVNAFFDAVSPDLTDLAVPTAGVVVQALVFDTSRAPFIVRNRKTDLLEVPWRDGTGVRSARREDLIRLLAPIVHRPEIEVREASLTAQQEASSGHKRLSWTLRLSLYVVPFSSETLILPCHQCRANIEVEGLPPMRLDELRLTPPRRRLGSDHLSTVTDSVTVEGARDQVILTGPGLVLSTSWFSTDYHEVSPPPTASVRVVLQPVYSLIPAQLELTLRLRPDRLKGLVFYYSSDVDDEHED